MRNLVAIVAAATAGLVGCVPSLQPIYGPDQLTFDPGLVGEWVTQDGDESWLFSPKDDNAYALVYTDSDDKEGCFVVHRTEVDGVVFLDLYPRELELDAACLYKFLLVPVHTFFKVERDGDRLTLAVADADWLGDHLEAHPQALAHETVNDGYLVTASTPELRVFFSKLAREGEGFGEAMKLTRKVGGDAETAPGEEP